MKKHNPIRMCAACRTHLPKEELIRIVRTPEGGLAIDRTGKLEGRGAYLCASEDCLALAEKKRALQRALRMEVRPEVYGALREELTDGGR